MLTSILPPVVDGPPRGFCRQMWLRLAVLYSGAAIVSAMALGGILATGAWFVFRRSLIAQKWFFWATIIVGFLYLPRELGWTTLPPLFQSTRQVPRRWAYDYPRWVSALLFGFSLGNGLFTRIVSPTYYLLIFLPFLKPGFGLTLVIWGAYGLARSGNVLLLASRAPVGDPFPGAAKVARALSRKSVWIYRANAAVLGITSGCLLASRLVL